MLIYGIHTVRARLELKSNSIKTVYFLREGDKSSRLKELVILAKEKRIPKFIIKKEQFQLLLRKNKIESANHQNVIAMCEANNSSFYQESDLIGLIHRNSSKNPFILILDSLQDPHNFGACIRSAEAVGVDFIIVSKNNSAKINSTVEKTSSGAINTIKLVTVSNLIRAIEILKQENIWILGLVGGSSQTIYDHDFTGAIALIAGSENSGLRFSTRRACDYLVSIPMKGIIPSLNVSVATGIALYEVLRQRIKTISKK